jgi:fructose-bisphosphate aldolase class II
MPLVPLKTILDRADAGGYAVPAFDTMDHASAEAVVQAAQELRLPVIVMAPEAAFPLISTDTFFPFLVRLAETAAVPVALQLDHGKSLEAVMRAIHGGFSAVMIDGSSLPLGENIALTQKIAALAHAAGVSVEAEIGHVAGGEGRFEGSAVDESQYTQPLEAKKFAEETGVDALAVAVGTVHGVYKGVPKLDFERLQEIKRCVGLPLVLHGGSGVSDAEFAGAIRGGIRKINLFTEISLAALGRGLDCACQRENKLHFAELIAAGKQAVYEIACGYLEKFGGEAHAPEAAL